MKGRRKGRNIGGPSRRIDLMVPVVMDQTLDRLADELSWSKSRVLRALTSYALRREQEFLDSIGHTQDDQGDET